MNTSWYRGPREATGTKGKNGGPCIRQLVVKIFTPKS
jgi:hypothetical protein